MTGAQFAILVVGLWVGAGLATMLWMARQGHRDPLWLLSAVVLGPVLAVIASERVERTPRVLVADDREAASAGRRALVGVDGSPESQAALEAVLDLLPREASRLVLAAVVDYDAADLDWRGKQGFAQERLAAARRMAGERDVVCEVLAGPPARALVQCAEQNDVHLIAVGRRGRGLSVRILGSVAEDLVRTAPAPVLIVGASSPAVGTTAL
ncbi:universal stress protein [Sanguibacter sp. 25GB23B1]|uniref:universal stress protein n=1 Tax=unclassified Sanguibacter TaxID=2645534 RepID=UPI0032AEEB01